VVDDKEFKSVFKEIELLDLTLEKEFLSGKRNPEPSSFSALLRSAGNSSLSSDHRKSGAQPTCDLEFWGFRLGPFCLARQSPIYLRENLETRDGFGNERWVRKRFGRRPLDLLLAWCRDIR
jgi:hypothetical protein